MSISDPFIERPIATSLVAAALLIAGTGAFFVLPVSPLPRVDFPVISVSANLPGASPETMASSVATPLERRFGRIAGLNEMTSTSGLGTTSITMQFDIDRNVESAARDVQAGISAAGGDLPPGLPTRPTYRKVNPADAPILIIALQSKSLPLAQVYDTANTILAEKIAQLPGVGQVSVGGGQQPAVRIQVDPEKLAAAGVPLDTLRTTIGLQTTDSPKGSITSASQMQVLSANDQLFNAAQWKDVIISGTPTSAIHLGDVARVTDSVENERAAGWTDQTRSVSLIIRRQPGANIIDVIKRVKSTLPELARMISPAIDFYVALDRSQTIQSSVHEVETSLVISVLLVVLVVFAFLRSVRATIIPSVAVPLSLIATFGVMYMLGYSLDNLSLMALTISTGFVVDDAIVVTENITRFVEEGMPPMQAAIKGAKQIGFTVVSITVSLLAVFIPILFMGGIVGRLFREFAVTLSIAISLSAGISLTITPAMASRLLKRGQESHGRLATYLERGYAWLERGYASALKVVIANRVIVGLVTIATILLTVVLFILVPKGLFPQQDTGLIMGTSDAPQDISFPAMKARQEALNAIVAEDPDVAHAVSALGTGFGSGAGNTGTLFIALKEKPPRTTIADEVIARLRPKLAKVKGVNLYLQAVQDVRIGGRQSRTQYQYTLQDANLAELSEWAPKLMAKLQTLPQLKDVATDQQTGGLKLDIVIDRDSASRLGITAESIDDALNDAFGQRQIALSYTMLNSYRVVMEVDPRISTGPEVLDHIYVTGASNTQVPLSAIAKWTPGPTTLSVSHQSQFAAVTLSFNTAANVSIGQAVDVVANAQREIGLPASILAGFAGTAQAFQDSLKSEKWLVLMALVVVYLVLGILYESFIHPITILSTIPSAGVGALLALLLTNTELSVIGMIAIILLIGIVKKNAIMMIDFAIEAERDEGLSSEEAIYKACIMRFRPILMTTLAALLGAVPLAIGGGTGSEMRRPLGIAIVGGLILSQMLTLFTTPVTYLALDRFAKRKPKHAPDDVTSSRAPLVRSPSP